VTAGETLSGFSLPSFKMGAVLLLLLWGSSECFNNEKLGRDVWHVSAVFLQLPTIY
jgi:hypothetical protein